MNAGFAAAATLLLASACSPRPARDTLAGDWVLDRARTRYGPGAHARVRERFTCAWQDPRVSCRIVGDWVDGTHVDGTFTAAYDGRPYPVTGVPGMDAVSLRRDGEAVEATFSRAGAPVYAYRARRGDRGKSLVITSVDPETRRPVNSVVVYDAR